MRALLLGARGAVGTAIRRELEREGHEVTSTGRSVGGLVLDLHGDLATLGPAAAAHDVVINASGVERADLGTVVSTTPLVDISATGSYLDALRKSARGTVVLGAGLAPGLSTVLVSALDHRPGDDIDVFVMLGSGEHHGAAAVDWTAGLLGTDVHQSPETTPIRNFHTGRRATGPDGRRRLHLRADFPDHVLLGREEQLAIRSYLALGTAPETLALAVLGRLPALRGLLAAAPHLGGSDWHVIARNRRTGHQREAFGTGQSEATGHLAALAASRAAVTERTGAITMADLVDVDAAMASVEALRPSR
ncbi:saccharopine dehydrogenase [Dietzia sp. SYD-A1]|uniref:saccharopine dehydrogenase n=1 Tax=Dietzia sp. SYD-A1 TaxID=2780141 RepID=UPI0018913EF9|nr:saccharopine dehydrogenase [Dietzia sp. SYD-A1]